MNKKEILFISNFKYYINRMDENMTLGDRIKKQRKLYNISQTELAHIVGYKDKTSIAKIEAGKIDLPQSKIIAFAEALDVSPDYLMGYDTPQSEIFNLQQNYSSLEQEIINHYRIADEIDKTIVLRTLHIEEKISTIKQA